MTLWLILIFSRNFSQRKQKKLRKRSQKISKVKGQEIKFMGSTQGNK